MQTTHRITLSEEYIAEAQRVAIAQNPVMRFLYLTWWAWWVPRIFLAAAMVFLLTHGLQGPAAMLAFFLALSFLGELLGRRNLAKARGRTRGKGTTTTVSMNDDGIDVVGAHGNSHTRWMALLPPAIRANGVALKFSRITVLWLPDSALIEGSADEVRQLLAKNVVPAK